MAAGFVRRRAAALGVAALAAAVPAAAQWPAPAVARWSRADGLPSDQVHGLAQDRNGLMWMAGPAGLARYDGTHFKRFGRGQGLSTQGLRSLALAPDGTLWIGSDAGVDGRAPDGGLQRLAGGTAWPHGLVEVILPLPGGDVWLGASNGAVRWSAKGGFEPAAPALPAALVTGLALDSQGRVWAAGPALGVWVLDQEWRRVDDAAWRRAGAPRVVVAADRGEVLVGGASGLVLLDADGRGSQTIVVGGAVTAATIWRSELWVGIGGALRLFVRVDGVWRAEQTVLSEELINALLVDAQGNLWIATDSRGVARISALRSAIRSVTPPCSTQTMSIAAARSGGLLLGGDRCSWRADADLGRPQPIASLAGAKVWDLREDAAGRLWAATEAGVLSGASDGALRAAAGRAPELAVPARVLLERADGMWVGTVRGLVVVGDAGAHAVLDRDGRSLGYVYTLAQDQLGRLWVGTLGRGLWRLDAEGVPEPVIAPDLRPDGNTYGIATSASGRAVVVQDERTVLLDTAGGSRLLPAAVDDPIAGWAVQFESEDVVWVGGNQGLVRHDLRAADPPQRLTAVMGLAGEEFTTSRSLLLTGAGLLCGFQRGLSVVDPARLAKVAAAPEPRAAEPVWHNADVRSEGGVPVVGYGSWTLDVSLFSPWFVDERSLRFRYRIAGFEQDWSAPLEPPAFPIQITALPAGPYALEAQAFSPLTGWGPAKTLLSFAVSPPWWNTPAFVASGVGLGVALVVLGWRARSHTLRRRAAELEELVEDRTAELLRANAELERLAMIDGLTGLLNQRGLWERLALARATHSRRGLPFGLVMMDLDHFKSINDRFGHTVGDLALTHVARVLKAAIRQEESVARYGGEEFLVVVGAASAQEVADAAERLRATLERTPFEPGEGNPQLTLTGSFGWSLWQGEKDDLRDLVRRADAAMYRAKTRRNAVEGWVAEPAASGEPGSA